MSYKNGKPTEDTMTFDLSENYDLPVPEDLPSIKDEEWQEIQQELQQGMQKEIQQEAQGELQRELLETSTPKEGSKLRRAVRLSPKKERLSRDTQEIMGFPQGDEHGPTVVKAPERKEATPWTVIWAISKYIWRIGLGVVLAVLILGCGLVGYLSVAEYNPAYAETADRGSVNRAESLSTDTFSILSFNTGYGGLGETADFFMDGGIGVLPESKELVEENMEGIEKILEDAHTDFIFLQEVDTDSRRSFHNNQWLRYEHELEDYESRFALNYSCDYVPYPFTTPMGKIQSGLATYSKYDIVSATRYSLPNAFTWPNRVANLKRCILVTRIPIEDSEQQLVLINVHMEAYDKGDGKSEQIGKLVELVKEEYAKGNFVIAGGDFNQTFPDCRRFEVTNPDYWKPGRLGRISDGFRYVYDNERPTCRLLNQPYDRDSDDTQHYVIDGFLISPNVTVERVMTLDYKFAHSDHNPVKLEFSLNMDHD